MSTNLEQRRQICFDYIKDGMPIPLKSFLKNHHITKATFFKYQGEYNLIQKQTTAIERSQEFEKKKDLYLKAQGFKSKDPEVEKAEKLAEKIKELDDAVFQAAKVNRIARMAELWYKRHGLITEKSESKVKLELSADEHARRNLEAERRLRESGYRVEDVQEEPPLLSE